MQRLRKWYPALGGGVVAGNSSVRGESVASRLLRVLDAFSVERPELGLTDVSRTAGLPPATAYRLLRELIEHGAVQRTAAGRYAVGLDFWETRFERSDTMVKLVPTGPSDVAGPPAARVQAREVAGPARRTRGNLPRVNVADRTVKGLVLDRDQAGSRGDALRSGPVQFWAARPVVMRPGRRHAGTVSAGRRRSSTSATTVDTMTTASPIITQSGASAKNETHASSAETTRSTTTVIRAGRLPRRAGTRAASVLTPSNAKTTITGRGAASWEPMADRKAMSIRAATANRMADAVGRMAE